MGTAVHEADAGHRAPAEAERADPRASTSGAVVSGSAAVLMLQRRAGNRAVAAALSARSSRQHSVQRRPDAPTVATPPPAPTAPPSPAPGPANDDQLNTDVNTYADERLTDYRRDFSNGLAAFRNWYFEQDEAMEPLFAEFKTIVEHAGDQANGPLATVLRTPFSDAAAQMDVTRTGFLTSLVKVIDAFGNSVRGTLQGQVAQRLTPDARWADVRRVHQESGDWHEQLHLAGLPGRGARSARIC